jgi:hypothetical protein
LASEALNRTVADFTPDNGDRIELLRIGVRVRGTVFYADELQMLVKWDEGRSESVRRGVTDGLFRIVEE